MMSVFFPVPRKDQRRTKRHRAWIYTSRLRSKLQAGICHLTCGQLNSGAAYFTPPNNPAFKCRCFLWTADSVWCQSGLRLRRSSESRRNRNGLDTHSRESAERRDPREIFERTPSQNDCLLAGDYLEESNSLTVANGSDDQGRKRLRVNFVFCPGFTSTCT